MQFQTWKSSWLKHEICCVSDAKISSSNHKEPEVALDKMLFIRVQINSVCLCVFFLPRTKWIYPEMSWDVLLKQLVSPGWIVFYQSHAHWQWNNQICSITSFLVILSNFNSNYSFFCYYLFFLLEENWDQFKGILRPFERKICNLFDCKIFSFNKNLSEIGSKIKKI